MASDPYSDTTAPADPRSTGPTGHAAVLGQAEPCDAWPNTGNDTVWPMPEPEPEPEPDPED